MLKQLIATILLDALLLALFYTHFLEYSANSGIPQLCFLAIFLTICLPCPLGC